MLIAELLIIIFYTENETIISLFKIKRMTRDVWNKSFMPVCVSVYECAFKEPQSYTCPLPASTANIIFCFFSLCKRYKTLFFIK